MGFSRNIGVTSSFEVELWALRDGLSICVDKNYSAIEVELDAKAIIDIFLNPNQSSSFISPLLDDCRPLASLIPRIQFKHCFREANRCADHLARKRTKLCAVFSLFENPPVDLLCL